MTAKRNNLPHAEVAGRVQPTRQRASYEVAPRRIQRKRTKGWKMPPNTVSVTRPGRWGNPYRASLFRDYSRDQQVSDFKRWLAGDVGARVWAGPPPTKKEIRKELRGKNLACFCPLDQPCHGDILLKIANGRS